MNTIEENKVAVNYVELEGNNLLELLEGVSTHAGRSLVVVGIFHCCQQGM